MKTGRRLSQRKQSQGIAIMVMLLLSALAPIRGKVNAQAPDRVEAFVYATSHFDGMAYGSAMAPPSVKTIYLMADVDNVIMPRKTIIYYWPLTNKYLPDWARKNEFVKGVLEVYRNERLIRAIDLATFIIQYDSSNPLETLRLYTNSIASERYGEFERQRDAHIESQKEYSRSFQAWQDEMEDLLLEGGLDENSSVEAPDKPDPPTPMSLYSTRPAQGYPLSLPAGSYRIQVRLLDGEICPDSQKDLVVFSHLREAVGYEVISLERWTRPEEAFNPNHAIYISPTTTILMQPYHVHEYQEFYYLHMNDPQSQASLSEHGVWISQQPVTDGILRVSEEAGRTYELDLAGYVVQQLSGPTLGYEILPADPGLAEEADIWGYLIPTLNGSQRLTVAIADADGSVIPGSIRQVRVNPLDTIWMVYVISGLPLVMCVVVLALRRQQVRQRVNTEYISD